MDRRSKRGGDSKTCDVKGCDGASKRTVSSKALEKSPVGFTLEKEGKRISLCKDHYREFRKSTKKDRTMDRLAWSS